MTEPAASSGGAGGIDVVSVEALMRRGISEKVFPGAVLRVARGRTVLYSNAFGVTDLASKRPVTLETRFDLASLTKPLATALSVLLLVQEGLLSLDQTLGRLLPAFRDTPRETITVRQLLCHTSGLPAHRPYYRELTLLPTEARKSALNAFLAAEPLVHPVGCRMVYSDLGFMILRWLVEEISGMRLDRFVARRIYHPLWISSLFYIDLAASPPPGEFAATQRCPWRGRVLERGVGDDNAYALGGIDGHAGLFGTAGAVGELLGEVLAVYRGEAHQGLFSREWMTAFLRRDPLSGRALGFDMPAPEGSSSGRFFSPQTVGHLGYTGTSFWLDPVTGISVVLLTNRVHPDTENLRIRAFRPMIHDAILAPGSGF